MGLISRVSSRTYRKKMPHKIVFVRHGESQWNLKNLFCGWYDADLSDKGVEEAHAGGKALKEAGVKFDCAYTSVLTRANRTLDIILSEMGENNMEINKTWRLNERHYGALTGLNKAETAEKYGADQVQIWRRSFNTPPPAMKKDHDYYNSIVKDDRYASELKEEEFPAFESLELTIKRTLPYWNDVIVPALKAGKTPIVAAHGNSLRGIVYHLDKMDNATIMKLNLPTGIPFVYELDDDMNPTKSMQFLGDEATVKAAMEKVANQIKK